MDIIYTVNVSNNLDIIIVASLQASFIIGILFINTKDIPTQLLKTSQDVGLIVIA